MYRILKNRPTILDYIVTWRHVVCDCGQEIDVCWIPDEFATDGQWTDHTWIATHCPTCVLAAAPEKYRPGLTDRYERLRTERLALGLGRVFPDTKLNPIDPEETARKSLGWHSGAITLHATTWRRSQKNRKNRPSDMYMVQLTVVGRMSLRVHLDSDVIARRPVFEIEPGELADGSEGRDECARVLLGATTYDPRRPGLAWRYSWNRSLPAAQGFFSLPPDWQWYDYSPAQVGAFVRKAMDLYQARDPGGRPQKRTLSDLQNLVQQYRGDHQGQDPTKEKLAELADVDSDTILNTLQREDIPTYQEFLNATPTRHKKAHTIKA